MASSFRPSFDSRMCSPVVYSANEAEDFQAVGIKCREDLIALVQEHADAEWVGTLASAPKRSDVKGWGDVFAQKLTHGRMRAYLKGLFETTWDLVVWLQHYKNAVPWDAELVLDATSHLIEGFGVLLRRHEQGPPKRCPRCESYRVSNAFETVERPQPGFTETPVCAACDRHGESSFTSSVEREAEVAAYQKRKTAGVKSEPNDPERSAPPSS